MALTLDFFALVTRTAAFLSLICAADRLPPPTGLSYEWLDAFTVHVSWLKPVDLPGDCEIAYDVQSGKEEPIRTSLRNLTFTCLGEEAGSTGCKYIIQTVSKDSEFCDRDASTPVTINTDGLVPRDEVMKDFKCVAYVEKIDCSWEPVNPSLNLTISHRVCGKSEKDRIPLEPCNHLYSNGTRNGCYLRGTVYAEVCMLVKSEAGRSTFRLSYMIPPPKLNIKEEGDQLKLNWSTPEVGKTCSWIYDVCYTRCSEPPSCSNFKTTLGQQALLLPYDKKCRYVFTFRARSGNYCTEILSEFSEATYGTDEPPDGTMTVVAIVIPIFLSISVILSCYCFRRHSAIICPVIPDPSAIFKEMMMTKDKELKMETETLYAPVPETIEPCKITLVPEDDVLLMQNS